MSEQLTPRTPESVWWINARKQPGKIERLKRFLYNAANLGTYHPKIDNDTNFSTSIPAEDIDTLEDEQLKKALHDQYNNIANGDRYLTIPVVTPETLAHKLTWTVSRVPLKLPTPFDNPVVEQ